MALHSARAVRALFLAGAMAVLPAVALAAPVAFDQPAEALDAALKQAAAQGGLSIAFDGALTDGKTAPALHGRYEPVEALRRLLAGSNLTVSVSGTSVVVTRASGAIALGPVRVEGTANTGTARAVGPNGSTDPTATEGTGSYTTSAVTVGSKAPLSILDTPQSVSVITQQRIQEQHLDSLYDALNQVPGISLVGGNTSFDALNTIYSRGFQITTLQIDGGASSQLSFRNQAVGDMAEYDHLEVLRGADGMFLGAGNPGGAISLERKRPLDHDQMVVDLQGGSWNDYREMVDLTGPVAFDGAVRARLVVSHQDQDYFYKIANAHETLVYGIVEADLTPTTLLTFGGSWNWNQLSPFSSGLPRYSNGASLGLPRDTCLCTSWSHLNPNNTEGFFKLRQTFGPDWWAELNFTTTSQDIAADYAWSTGTVNPVTLTGTSFRGTGFIYRDRNYLLDLTLHGKFELFGLPQELVTGVNLQKDEGDAGSYTYQLEAVPYNIFSFNQNVYPRTPTNPIGSNNYNYYDNPQLGWYTTLRLQPIKRLHLTGGFRLSSYEDHITTPLVTYTNLNESAVVTPYGAIAYDLTRQLSLYGNYTTIFQSQSGNLKGPLPGTPLPPVTGDQYEAGLKGSFNNGKLNGYLAYYHINQRNQAVSDPNYASVSYSQVASSCCYLAEGDILSQGVDFELTGEVLPRWQMSLGYTYNDNVVKYGSSEGQPNVTLAPKHLVKIWTTYRLPSSWNDRITLGGGVNAQSSVFSEGSVPTGISPSGTAILPNIPYAFTSPGYIVLALRASYALTSHIQASINVDNATDKVYYSAVGGTGGGNIYGTPRSFTFDLHMQY